MPTSMYYQITATGGIAPGNDPTGPSRADKHKIISDALNSGGFSFLDSNFSRQPYHGRLETGDPNPIDLYIYAWRIIPGRRPSRLSEKRIEISKPVDRKGFRRPITATEKTILLGIYDSPHGTPIFAAWAADDWRNKNPRQRSVYVNIEDLQAAIAEGIHSCPNKQGDQIYTFLPEHLGNYIDLLAGNNTLPLASAKGKATAASSLSSRIMSATKDLKGKRTIRSVESVLASISKLSSTERDAIVKQRVGQGYFKDLLLDKYSCKCALCDITTRSMLIASHIKSWSASKDAEKLDENNGLLLCAHHDALFDKHLISFDDSGALLVSSTLTPSEQAELRISAIPSITVTPRMKPYLAEHRSKLK